MRGCPSCGQRFLGNEEFCPKDGATLVEMDGPEEDSLIGTTVDGRYTIDKKIGEGGMGVVYLSTHAIIGKKCAIKVLRKELATETEVAERFTQEARAAAAIGNEHIIEITDFGQLPDGSAYFVMEFLDGRSIHDDLKDGAKIEAKKALHMLGQCCDALAAAHAANIVHRDLKPENIVLIENRGDPDFIKILDFGIAKVARESGRLTRTGVIFGTPQYMSPEQAAGTDIDERTDVYSLGIIMYEMLCGHVPFEADTFMGVLTKHLYEEPIPPRRLMPPIDIPQSVEAVLLKAVAKKPEKRYQSMTEFGEDIRALAEGKTPKIVYAQMNDTTRSTAPPLPPSEIVSGKKSARPRDEDDVKLPGSNWRLFAGIGAAAVIIVVAVFVFVLGSGEESNATAQTQEQDTGAAVDTQQVDTGTAEDPEDKTTVTIALASEPAGASLYQHGALVGKLPLEIPRPGADNDGSKYALKLTGFQDMEILVNSATPETLKVELEPEAEEVEDKKPSSKGRGRGRNKDKSDRDKPDPKPQKVIKIQKNKNKNIGGDIADPWAD